MKTQLQMAFLKFNSCKSQPSLQLLCSRLTTEFTFSFSFFFAEFLRFFDSKIKLAGAKLKVQTAADQGAFSGTFQRFNGTVDKSIDPIPHSNCSVGILVRQCMALSFLLFF